MAQDVTQEEREWNRQHPDIWDTQCPECGDMFTENGLAVHRTRAHRQKVGKNKAAKSKGASEAQALRGIVFTASLLIYQQRRMSVEML